MNAPDKFPAVSQTPYQRLAAINVNEHTEKKQNLTYLSWAWAVDQLMRQDHAATWEYLEPLHFGETMMVRCAVTAFGKTMTAQLPVMNHRNQAISNPDSFAVNTAMQRCLAKAIALHGLGLYIYAGEDLPEDSFDELLVGYEAAAENGTERLLEHHKATYQKGNQLHVKFWAKHGDQLKKQAQKVTKEVTA
jgi:hypothetical protein